MKMKNRWLIAASAVGIHLSIGSVYSWSVFTRPITAELGWSLRDVQFTFSISILFLGLSAALFGHFVEKYGPRRAGTVASIFFGIGICGSGLAILLKSIYGLYFCYGVLGGMGLGVGYIVPVSTLVKWFPDRRGLATGLAIMGFGFASLIAGPVIQKMIVPIGLAQTFFTLGLIYFIIIFISSQYLAPPPAGWVPKGWRGKAISPEKKHRADLSQLRANEAVKTRRFYWLWLMLFINVTCGIAVISVASAMAQEWDSADTFAIELDDEGIPFDPLSVKAPDINRPIEEREADGLGVFLMRKMTDEARYVREGNRNRLTLIINKASAE